MTASEEAQDLKRSPRFWPVWALALSAEPGEITAVTEIRPCQGVKYPEPREVESRDREAPGNCQLISESFSTEQSRSDSTADM
jgi:hypothetical protein